MSAVLNARSNEQEESKRKDGSWRGTGRAHRNVVAEVVRSRSPLLRDKMMVDDVPKGRVTHT